MAQLIASNARRRARFAVATVSGPAPAGHDPSLRRAIFGTTDVRGRIERGDILARKALDVVGRTVDLPLDAEQAQIFRIHLSRRGVDLSSLNIPQLTKLTNGWTGAEIEQCVVSALTKARLADREVEQNDLIDVAAKFVPLSRTMKEQISKIRSWAFERAIRASPLPQR